MNSADLAHQLLRHYVARFLVGHRGRLAWMLLLVFVAPFNFSANFHAAGAVPDTPFRRDPPDQPFRYAPLADATRSIVIAVRTNLHVAFDSERLNVYTVWVGQGVKLYGPPYSGRKTPALAQLEGEILWKAPQLFSFVQGTNFASVRSKLPQGARFKAIDIEGTRPVLKYTIPLDDDRPADFSEYYLGNEGELRRCINLPPLPQQLSMLFLSDSSSRIFKLNSEEKVVETGGESPLAFELREPSRARWFIEKVDADYPISRAVEKGGDTIFEISRVKGRETRVWLVFPASPQEQRVEVSILYGPTADARIARKTSGQQSRRRDEPAPRNALPGNVSTESVPSEPVVLLRNASELESIYEETRTLHDEFVQLERIAIPPELELLVTGLAFLRNGDLAITTWIGEVWIVHLPVRSGETISFRRFAQGLNEPLGLAELDGDLFVVQKPELTRLSDRDGDGIADRFMQIAAPWDYTGNYHAFAFGPALNSAGDLFAMVCGAHGSATQVLAGWALTVKPADSRIVPFASGLRSSNGWILYGSDEDLFVTDNQGEWVGTCKLNHVQSGHFYGFPSGTSGGLPPANESPRAPSNPAVWFPRKWSASASGMAVLNHERWGPFQGQILVGEWQNSSVMRLSLEKVRGEWQGTVWPFARGFRGSVNRLAMASDGSVFVGGCKRTWPSAAPLEGSLERLVPTGKIPFEVAHVRARPDGFELDLTKPADPNSLRDLESVSVSQFTYRYHAQYGSPEVDHDGNANHASSIRVTSLDLSQDGRRIGMRLEGLRAGFVTEIKLSEVRSAENEPIWHDTFYYTLNQLPSRN